MATGNERVPNQQSSELTPVNSTSSGSNKKNLTRRAFLRETIKVGAAAFLTPVLAPLLNQPSIARAEIKAADKEAEKPFIHGGFPEGDVGQGPLIERQPTAFKLAVNESGTSKINQAAQPEGDASDEDANLSNPTVAETPTQAPGPNDEGPQPPETSKEIDLPLRSVEAAAVSAPSEEDSIVQQGPAVTPSPLPAASPAPAAKPASGPTQEQIERREKYLAELEPRLRRAELIPDVRGKTPAFDSDIGPAYDNFVKLGLNLAQVGAADITEAFIKIANSKPKFNKRQYTNETWGGIELIASDQPAPIDRVASIELSVDPKTPDPHLWIFPVLYASNLNKNLNNMIAFADAYITGRIISTYLPQWISTKKASGMSETDIKSSFVGNPEVFTLYWKGTRDFIQFYQTHKKRLSDLGIIEVPSVTELISVWEKANLSDDDGKSTTSYSTIKYLGMMTVFSEDKVKSVFPQLD